MSRPRKKRDPHGHQRLRSGVRATTTSAASFEPTCTINGLPGWQGLAANQLSPSVRKLDFRPVPDQEPADISPTRRHLDAEGFADAQIAASERIPQAIRHLSPSSKSPGRRRASLRPGIITIPNGAGTQPYTR
jgi:hypothetical protein